MDCKCNWVEVLVGIVVVVLALWPDILGLEISKWVLVIAGALLIIHALVCKNCKSCNVEGKSMAKEEMKSSNKGRGRKKK
jgi:hypothetical protein